MLFHAQGKDKDTKKKGKDKETDNKSTPTEKAEALLLKKLSGITSAAKLNAPNKQGMTPLMVAASRNHRLAVCWLIAKGADVKARNKDGKTAYELTSDIRLRELLRLCAEEKEPLDESEAEWAKKVGTEKLRATLQSLDVIYLSYVSRDWKGGADIKGKNKGKDGGRQVLAAAHIPPESVAFLVRQGCDVNARNDDGSPVININTPSESIRLMLALGLTLDTSKEPEQKAAICALVAADAVNEVKKALKEHAELVNQSGDEWIDNSRLFRAFSDYLSGTLYPVNLLSLAQSAEMVKVLIEAGANPKQGTYNFSNTLAYAVWNHQPVPVVKSLIKALGADAKLNGDGKIMPSLLFWAQDAATARLLIEAGADPNANVKDFDNVVEDTPLDAAAYDGRLDVMKELLAAGAKPDACKTPTIRQIFSSLKDYSDAGGPFMTSNRTITPNFRVRIQRMRFLPDVIRALIKAGAKVDADIWKYALHLSRFPRTCDDMPLRDQLAAYFPILDALNESSAKLPTNALTKLKIPDDVKEDAFRPILEKLIALGADPKATDENSETILFEVQDAQILQCLVKAGFDINARNKWGHTPLFSIASTSGKKLTLDLYKSAVAAGADVKAKDMRNHTLLQPVTRVQALPRSEDPSAIDVARELLKAGLDVNSKDQDGETPIFRVRSKPMLDFLLQSGADPKIVDKAGNTTIHAAVETQITYSFIRIDADIIRTLVKAGVDVNARNKSGKTSLDEFVRTNHPSESFQKDTAPVLEALLDVGARLDPENAEDAKAIEYFKKAPIYEQIFKKHNCSLP